MRLAPRHGLPVRHAVQGHEVIFATRCQISPIRRPGAAQQPAIVALRAQRNRQNAANGMMGLFYRERKHAVGTDGDESDVKSPSLHRMQEACRGRYVF